MPSEIALLPMIESAFNPTAYSTAHAAGIWQFIPSTGRSYGLKQNWWQDERRDVLAATRAALDYLEKLYEMFNSWELALASYNWGEGAVQRAMQRNEARGMPTDYLSLDMPAETRNYIPKLMAVKNLIARPNDYGLRLAEIANRPYFAVVQTDKHIDVQLAAKLAEIPVEHFKALNPYHNRPVIRADVKQPILLPADRAELFQAKLQAHEGALTSWQPYTLGRDDRLDQVAQRFGIEVGKLRDVNSIPTRFRSLAGMTILVPAQGQQGAGDIAQAGFAQAAMVAEPVVAATPTTHIVRAGETLASIAQRYRMSVAQLATRNGIRNGKLLAGQTLTIGEVLVRTAQPVSPQAQAAPRPAQAPAKAVAQAKPDQPKKPAAPAAKSPPARAQVAYQSR
jgi:membrane-bound lytic murein transglycosylase D